MEVSHRQIVKLYQSRCFLSSSQQIRIQAFLARYIPSTYKTSLLSSIFGGIGQISQNFRVFLLKVLPSPGISRCVCLPNSHFKNNCSCFAELSIFSVNATSHVWQYHLWEPAPVLPYFIQTAPQTGQTTRLITSSSKTMVLKEDITAIYRVTATFFGPFTNTFCPPCIFFKTRYKRRNPRKFKEFRRFSPTRIVL